MLFYGDSMKRLLNYFTKFEIVLWSCSVAFITVSFFAFSNSNHITLVASIIGVTALIFIAKGNPFGQFLMVIFGAIYGYISFTFAYYGEMITYMGMTVPMAIIALVSWLKNPYKNKKSQVKVNGVTKKEVMIMIPASIGVTVVFYFILKKFGTANIIPSTFSVTTSFMAVYLSFRRSPYFALVYTLNDIVLIILWILASFEDISYLSVIICFVVFLFNDLYSFINWKRMQKKQMRNV